MYVLGRIVSKTENVTGFQKLKSKSVRPFRNACTSMSGMLIDDTLHDNTIPAVCANHRAPARPFKLRLPFVLRMPFYLNLFLSVSKKRARQIMATKENVNIRARALFRNI